jgi:large exoprotein involved in heme utilization and adhesion
VIIGRGGLPENPTQSLTGQNIWLDMRDFSAQAVTTKVSSRNYQLPPYPQEIVEAQGLLINLDGELELVASVGKVTPLAPWQEMAQCSPNKQKI